MIGPNLEAGLKETESIEEGIQKPIEYWVDQALRPRGITTKEKLEYILNWWDKTSTILPSTRYQKEYLESGRTIADQYREWLQLDVETLEARIRGAIIVHEKCYHDRYQYYPLHAY